MKRRFFETAELRSYCGYFLVICQLFFSFGGILCFFIFHFCCSPLPPLSLSLCLFFFSLLFFFSALWFCLSLLPFLSFFSLFFLFFCSFSPLSSIFLFLFCLHFLFFFAPFRADASLVLTK